MKFGRNDPCWCGSGEKYKKCHLKRSEQPPPLRGEIENALKSFQRKRPCMAPDSLKHECSGKIIKAHTISKSAGLKKIAHEGHVLGIKASIAGLQKSGGKLEFQSIGINQASTFSGFCSYHDKSLFEPIEDNPFQASQEQLFLLAYRQLVRELYLKDAHAPIIESLKNADKGRGLSEQRFIQELTRLHSTGIDLGVRDLKYFKGKMDRMIMSHHFSGCHHRVFELSGIPKIQAGLVFHPSVDFNGNTIDFGIDENIIWDQAIINLVSFDGKGYFICSWLEEHAGAVLCFIDSLAGQTIERMGDLIVSFIFAFCENVFASPVWWKELTETEKTKISERIMYGMPPLYSVFPKNCLVDDGLKYCCLEVENHYRLK